MGRFGPGASVGEVTTRLLPVMEVFLSLRPRAYQSLDRRDIRAARSEYRAWRPMRKAISGSPVLATTLSMFSCTAIQARRCLSLSILEVRHSMWPLLLTEAG